MAIIKTETKEIEVEDGSKIKDACIKLGVPFGCSAGVCGTCMIDVLEGANNLGELTKEEEDMHRDREHRLACQCTIKSGEVKITFMEDE